MKKNLSKIIFGFFLLYTANTQGQTKYFMSAVASVNQAAVGQSFDGDTKTGWALRSDELKKEQSVLFTLYKPGNVNGLHIVTDNLTAEALKKSLTIYVTYDPVNLGTPVVYNVSGNKTFDVSFPAKYGAHLKMVIKEGSIKSPVTFKEITVEYGGAMTDATELKNKPWLNASLPVNERVLLLLKVMTPAQKMELLREGWGIPGIPSLGIPFVNKVEAIHGFSYGSGATIFPQSIGLGATWNKQLIEKVAETIGDETVSANTVQAWSPVLDVAQDARWGRCEETYGEDPVLVSEIGGAWIKGYQSKGLMVTPKHFAAHGAPLGGRDSHDIGLSDREMREIHLVPFRHVIEKYKCQSIMVAYSDFYGVPDAKSKELLKGILREEWGFDGYVVSDCGAIGNLTSKKHFTATDVVEAANQSLAAGVATNCGDTYNNPKVIEAAKNGGLNMDDLNFTCSTLLATMFRNGLFDHNPAKPLNWNTIYPGWNSPAHKEMARQAARESIVLLKNEEKVLPLSKKVSTIAVIGPGADDLQPGDYTAKLQQGQLVSVLSGVKKAVGVATQVLFEKGCEFYSTDSSRIKDAVAAAKKAEVVVMVLGDCSTSEAMSGVKKTSGEANDYASLILPGYQQKLLEAVCAIGKPVVLILQSGRPYNLSYASQHCKAILVNWLPGQEGGYATADVLFGDYNPAGRLPMTFPKDVAQLPLYYNFKTSGRQYAYVDMPFYPLYPFGYGLSYTTFNYSDLKTSTNDDGSVNVTATVTNTGSTAGDEVVQLYVTDMYASVKTRVTELKDFARVTLAPGEAKKMSFVLSPYQLSLLNDEMDRVVEAGDFKILVGGKSPSFKASDEIKNSVAFTNSAEGVSTMFHYNKKFAASFSMTTGKIFVDSIIGKKILPVLVKNNGNLTDVGTISMYINGNRADDVHHFEVEPGKEKQVEFILNEDVAGKQVTFTSKHVSITKQF
ncbi:glycoside hydrolase family 3 C-terminal domain-containing protein [Pinibacter aurantiacus]|uniref:Glycoside hydrolase family 3 C-terminal domain-containing protein n=1 Tax=Pinibacter aurantiacus TaxID=2851599 RepID=A0A9E2S7E3_9BACT|nr:glycoside hydrolase family 3 C-terminal domain-containing protein [Pinibacter aurantiacus]MBV4357576.1 glycoside hydrolase family 3 C-terminal domain-containing protein [Pinibacter aurantiacus]